MKLTELADSISRATVNTDGKDEGMVPLAVGYINSKESCRLPDQAIPAETQETALGLQIQGPSNYQTDPYRHGHSLQYPPYIHHDMTHDQDPLFPGIGRGGSTGTYMVAYQYPTPSHPSQTFHSPQSQPQPQCILQTPQPAPLPGGSQHLHPIIEIYSAWERLRFDRMRWDPNALEPRRRDGDSILMDLTMRKEHKYQCRVPTQGGCCDYVNVRKDRLLHHIRKDHLNFFPFVCDGSCPSQNWYVTLCLQ